MKTAIIIHGRPSKEEYYDAASITDAITKILAYDTAVIVEKI